VPGKRITDQQIRLYMNKRKEGHTRMAAAVKAALSERTARRIDTGQLSTELAEKRLWRTRKDPLKDVCSQELAPLLEDKHALLPATLFDYLWSSRPRELPPQALTEPDVKLSLHPALLTHRPSRTRNPNVQITSASSHDNA
jgi:hypothetical protein